MVRISILYPMKAGARFDLNYYIGRHMPYALAQLGAVIKSVTVEVATEAPNWPPPMFIAMCHYLCDSQEVFESVYLNVAESLQADVVNYTDIAPLIQISEVRLSR